MSDKLKLGIIGMGTIGCIHAEAFQTTGLVDINAVCDINQDKVSQSKTRFGVQNGFSDYRELLKSNVQAVIIGLGNKWHLEAAVAALKAGKHVLLEKPMAMNASEAEQIASEAEKTGNVLQIAMVYRFKPYVQVLRDHIEKGDFGEIYHIQAVLIRQRGIPGLGSWFTTRSESGGGPMIDIGVHWCDLAMWLSGCWNPTSVSAKTYAKFGSRMKNYAYVKMWAGPPKLDGVFDVEDYATGMVRFGEKTTMTFNIAWAANAPNNAYLEIIGDKGGTRTMDDNPPQIITERHGRPTIIMPQTNPNANIYETQARSFIAACRGQKPPAVTAQEGVTVTRLIDAIYKSSELNREVSIA